MEIPTCFKNFGFELKLKLIYAFFFLGTCGGQVAESMIQF